MTTEVTQTDTLQQWWNDADFEGKKYCELKENGDLTLRQTPLCPERMIAALTTDNATALTKALVEKYPEVEIRVKEVREEWDNNNDKLKLLGKVSRLHEYLQHTNAIGDFNILMQQVMQWEEVLKQSIEDNYQQKLSLAEQAEKMSAESEQWKETTQALKELAEKWKNIGYIDKQRNDVLWERFEEAKNRFFERKRAHHDATEKEMLQNLDLKMEIVDKAEAVSGSEEWKNTTETFRQFMEQWKAIGHTWHDKNEELWSRFILAKNNFFERKNAHFEAIKSEQEQNYLHKQSLVERAEALKDSKDWTKTSHAYAAIMEEWKAIGRVPSEKADELWNKLHAAKDHFFSHKRQHTENLRVALEDNYARKLSLTKRAEELKNATQWRDTTEEMNELFTEWKKIGPVPREYGDTLWEQFIAARKHFFARKDADREKRKHNFERKMQQKEERSRNFRKELESELTEEREKLADFHIAIENITPGNKEKELRAHLEKLIKTCEQKIRHKEDLLADMLKQTEIPQARSDDHPEAATEQNQ